MAKKPTTKIKDPKKVAAGKARAKKALRIGGRFTSNKFFEDISEQAKDAGVKDVFRFFEQNEKYFSKLYSSWMQGTEYFDYTFLNLLKNYQGEVYVYSQEDESDLRKNTVGTALQKSLSFNQYLKNNHNVVAWSIMPFLKLSGKLKFGIPKDERMDEESDGDLESLEDFLSMYHIKIIVSEKKGRKIPKSYKLASRKGRYKKIETTKNAGKAKKPDKAASRRKNR